MENIGKINVENSITKFLDRKLDIFKVESKLDPIEEKVVRECITQQGYERYARWTNYLNSYMTLLPFEYNEICQQVLTHGLKPILKFCDEIKSNDYKLSVCPTSEFELLASDAYQFSCQMEVISHIESEISREKLKEKKKEIQRIIILS
ncbi:MAG: hypothetical protein PHV79_00855 [Clostridia bacterium]|jgi:hypothetical protein|nr:hypothetical protein [Clostridia bacterium]